METIKFNKSAINILGYKALVIAMEELSELQLAILNMKKGREDKNNLAEEIADVALMCHWISSYAQVELRLNNYKETSIDNAIFNIAGLIQHVSKLIRGNVDKSLLGDSLERVFNGLSYIRKVYNVSNEDVEKWLEYKNNRIEKRIRENNLY